MRFLCPNCNSQTPTFSGKGNKKSYKCSCGKEINKHSLICHDCFAKNRRKVEWPTKEQLEKMIWEKPTVLIGKEFKVSEKTVERWTKIYGIKKPSRGYWQKLNK